MDGLATSVPEATEAALNGVEVFKMTGSGNDFVFVDGRASHLDFWTPPRIRAVCSRRNGIGADGLVILEPGSSAGKVRFHFFNNDGGRAPMCGNAALCATRLATRLELVPGDDMELETDAGTFRTRCLGGPGQRAEIELDDVDDVRTPKIGLVGGETSVYLATVGVPHLVVLVREGESIDLDRRGRELRFHPAIAPDGANVSFVSRNGNDWFMRTYERGVEGETLACGTGAIAAAAALAGEGHVNLPWKVKTASDEVLEIYGEPQAGSRLLSPRLRAEARLVFRSVLLTELQTDRAR